MRDNPENIPEIGIKDWVSGSLVKGSSVSLAFDRRHLTHVEFLFYYRCRSTRISRVLMPTFVTVKITTGSFFFSLQSGRSLTFCVCSETAGVCVQAIRLFRSCYFILSGVCLLVPPMRLKLTWVSVKRLPVYVSDDVAFYYKASAV